MNRGISQDELVSRGEYFAARLMADYLGYDFLDQHLLAPLPGWTVPWISPPATRPCAAPPLAAGW